MWVRACVRVYVCACDCVGLGSRGVGIWFNTKPNECGLYFNTLIGFVIIDIKLGIGTFYEM